MAGWSTTGMRLIRARSPTMLALGLVRNLVVRSLPPGTQLYVGHSQSLDEVLACGQHRLLRRF